MSNNPLIEADGSVRFIPSEAAEKVAVGINHNGAFVQVKTSAGTTHHIYMSREELVAVGIACIQVVKTPIQEDQDEE
jgi:hypothetical protein